MGQKGKQLYLNIKLGGNVEWDDLCHPRDQASMGGIGFPAEEPYLALWMLPACSSCSSMTAWVHLFSFALQQIKFNF